MKTIDLSQVLDNSAPVYPGDYKTLLSRYKSMDADGYNLMLLQSCMHTGTHIDVPMHLTDDTRTAADFDPERFAGRGVLLDVRGEGCIDVKREYDNIVRQGDVVLLYTGFGERYHDDDYFTSYPEVSFRMWGFLLEKRIKMLGMDAPAPDYMPFEVHKALLKGGVMLLENLTNLQSLTGAGEFQIYALPLKIRAEGSPVRAVAIVG